MKKALSVFALSAVLVTPMAQAEEVNIYSFRQAFLIKPLLDAFTEETGIKANVVFSKKGLLERIEHEGRNSPADVLLTSDIGPLYDAVEKGLLQPISSDTLNKNIPEKFRNDKGLWYGLTSRSRIIYASKDRVKEGEIKTYEDLADPKWKGRICTRSGKHPYNVALVAAMVAEHGEADTLNWLKGVKANLARKPQGSDRAQVQAIHQGLCDLSLGNSYYFGKMLKDKKQKVWADAVNINFPNQKNRGAHVNISGVAMAKYAPHSKNAKALMEFLASKQAQAMYAETNMEYPVRAGVQVSELVASWGDFKADHLPLETIAANRKTALVLLDKVQFDL